MPMTFIELLKKKFISKRDKVNPEDIKSEEVPVTEEVVPKITEDSEPIFHYQRSRSSIEDEEEKSDLLKKAYKLKLSPKNPIKQFWRRYHLGKVLLIIAAGFVLLTGGYLFYLAKTAKVSDLQEALKMTTVIYDRNSEYAGSLTGQKGTYVELDAISDDLERAVIATEDRSFYSNKGINFTRTLLAVVTLGKSGGGSTITQQLAKNAYLTQDQTVKRKAREFFLALELTKKYSKDEILTMYLNNAYFGNGVWGVEDASQKYFGTSAAYLTLEQSATLAGMLKGPELYNPYYSLENATNRRNTVLQAMVSAEVIGQDVADQAMGINMENHLADTYAGKIDDYKYPSYFDAVISEAIETYGLSEKDILNNGYKIYTELDQNYQVGMQTALDDDQFIYVAADGEKSQAASVALDPKTGGVRGLVGRSDSTENVTFRSFNYATQARRSPASTIKPLIAYAPALATGWSIEELLPNKVRDFSGYSPANSGGVESEDVPMYQALANSYNIPAVYAVEQLGIDKAISYGKKFGLSMSEVPKELGVALGAGVTASPLQMTQAYSAFANGGVMHNAHLITRIETSSGEVIKEYKPWSKRVVSQTVADQMTSMMLGTFTNGTAAYANAYGYTLAGKTGTNETSFDVSLISDQWVIGYTPDVVLTQWLGFSETDETHYIDDPYGNASALYSTLASYVLPYTEGTGFTVENAYAQNGIPAITVEETETDASRDIIDDLADSAQRAQEEIARAVEEANLPAQAENLWNSLVEYFR